MKSSPWLPLGASAAALSLLAFSFMVPGKPPRIPMEPLPPKGRFVPPRRTVLTPQEVAQLAAAEYRRRFGQTLTRAQVAVLVAQWWVETAGGRATYNFNFGNVKASQSWTGWFTVLRTWEYHRRQGKLVKERWMAPFRAYQTAPEGISAWLGILFSERHGGSRRFVLSADPTGFARSLANVADGGSGYATARADKYAAAITSAYNRAMGA